MLTKLGLERKKFTISQLADLSDAHLLLAAELKGVTVKAGMSKREIAAAVMAQKAVGKGGAHLIKPVPNAEFRAWAVGAGGLLSATGKQYLDRVFSRWGQPPSDTDHALLDLPVKKGLVPWKPGRSLTKKGSRLRRRVGASA